MLLYSTSIAVMKRLTELTKIGECFKACSVRCVLASAVCGTFLWATSSCMWAAQGFQLPWNICKSWVHIQNLPYPALSSLLFCIQEARYSSLSDGLCLKETAPVLAGHSSSGLGWCRMPGEVGSRLWAPILHAAGDVYGDCPWWGLWEPTYQGRRHNETWVRFLGQEDPLEEGTATHSSILA